MHDPKKKQQAIDALTEFKRSAAKLCSVWCEWDTERILDDASDALKKTEFPFQHSFDEQSAQIGDWADEMVKNIKAMD